MLLFWELRITKDDKNGAVKREFFLGNLLVRIHCIIVMIWWTGLAPWEFEFPFPGSLASTFLVLSLLLLSAEEHPEGMLLFWDLRITKEDKNGAVYHLPLLLYSRYRS